MSDETLRDRITDLIDEHVYPTIMDDVAGVDRAAQAIIDEFGLHYVHSEEYARVGLECLNDGDGELVEKGRHIVGKWEKQ